jgi:hypothetical protein
MFDDVRTTSKRREIKRNKFTREEDEELQRLVESHGTSDWTMIARQMENGRTKRQVRERWQSYLNPDLATEYSEADDELLQQLHRRVGPKWSLIAVALHSKSGISVRNRYRTLESLRQKGFKPDYSRQSPAARCDICPNGDRIGAVDSADGGCDDSGDPAVALVELDSSVGIWEIDFENFL